MAEREHILADFQACTGKDDIEECIVILEQYDWNLMDAVQNAMADSPHGAQLPREFTPPPSIAEASHGLPMFHEAIIGNPYVQADSVQVSNVYPADAAGSADPLFSLPGPSAASVRPRAAPPVRLLNFNIEYRDRTMHLLVPDNDTVGKLKEQIEMECAVSPSNQHLVGLEKKNSVPVSDEDLLRSLRLPKETNLILLSPDVTQPCGLQPNNGESPALLERLSQTFTLNIRFKEEDKLYKLNFPGSKTVQEVKSNVYALTEVPVRNQLWSGWPEAARDETMTLAGCGIGYPCHELEVTQTKSKPAEHHKPREESEERTAEQIDDDMEMDTDDDYEDAHDSFGLEELDSDIAGPRKPQPLMAENATNETEALEGFAREFEDRYGPCHPVFFIGSLENALSDALQCSARDRKLLAVYLHHDGSILANVFCSQILCAESIVQYLSSNFLVWAWDLTSDANKAKLLTLCTRHFGSTATNTVRTFKPDELPLLLIISRNRGSNEVVTVIRGNATLDELMTQLLHASEVFREQSHVEIREEDERADREQVKQEQDWAYQESLASDRAKEEQKKLEEQSRLKKEEEENQKKMDELLKREEEEAAKEAIRASVADMLPDEPPATCSQPITTIRFRCPDGKVLVRRFLAQSPLKVLLNYVTSQGYHDTDFKVLATFPRKDLTQGDTTKTLEELKLCPQETLMLEEK